MSNELVKTAPADRSSVKAFQSVHVFSRSRIGCRMMSPLAARPLCHVPPSSCLLAALSSVSSCRLVLSPRRSCRVSVLCSPARLVLRLVASFRRAYSSSMFVSSHPLISSCPLSLRPPAPPCLLSPSLVSPGGASSSRSHLVMRFACRLCVLACRPASRSSSGCGCGMFSPCLPSGCGWRMVGGYPRLVPAFRCYRAASALSRLCGRVLLSACLCYTVCRSDGAFRLVAFVPRSHKLPQITGGRRGGLLFS